MSVKIVNFGCRLNSSEANVIEKQANDAGLDALQQEVVIFNSCAVTKEALRQTKQAIRKQVRENKNVKIIVTGCGAQTDPKAFSDMAEVDFVIGNMEKLDIATYERIKLGFGIDQYEKVLVNDIMSIKQNTPHMVDAIAERARSYVQIQNGCDHNCTFCIIPYGRGRSRSVPIGAVIQQINVLCETGCKEIVLTGVDLTSYGADLPSKPTLATLVRDILEFSPKLQRLRISSIDSIEVDNQLFELLATEKRIMPHLHLSLQSGSNMILKRMKRRHLREDAIRFCTELQQLRPEVTFGADLIAGFPTETDEMFNDTVKLIDECNLTFLHIFPFSAHDKVPASRMPQVKGNIIKQRAAILRQMGAEKLAKHLDKKIGKTEQLLVETTTTARADDYSFVLLNDGENYTPGSIIYKKIVSHDGKAGKIYEDI